MTQLAELHQKIDKLPPECFGEVIGFVEYLQQKMQNEKAELFRNIGTLPPEYFGEVIDFVEFLRKKAQNEGDGD